MRVDHNVALSEYTSLKAGGLAETLLTLEPGDSLVDAVKEAQKNEPIWVLGYCTNCLISDKGLPGTVILNRTGKIERQGDKTFKAESGALWDDLVQQTITVGLWGLELASGIPGGVGAAISGDIAAYGHKVADALVEATVLNPGDGSVATWKNPDFDFGYRTSALQLPKNNRLIVIDATFELSNKPVREMEYHSAKKIAEEMGLQPGTLENRRKIILETRRRAGSLLQDAKAGPWTAGSFFKNPLVSEDQIEAIISHEETGISREHLLRQNQLHSGSQARVSAAHVLLAAGFHRGQTWGQVRLHPDHILKLENLGNATAQEMYEVVQTILTTVKQKLGIELEPEVRFLGEFGL